MTEIVESPIKKEKVSPEGLIAIDRILNYENRDVLDRFMDIKSTSKEDAETAFHSFKQFMVVNAFMDGIKTPSQAIDNFWHVFLLYMRQYESFCKEYLKGMVYHDPGKDDRGMAFYPLTRACAYELCGVLDENYWPENHAPHPKARCVSCSDCNPRFS